MVSHQQLLAQAQQLCEQRGVRLTPQRGRVLQLILSDNRAISAYELLDLLRETEPQAKPPTVYRALDFLLAQGFVHKVESTNSYIACRHLGKPEHCSQLLICDSCGNVDECHADELAEMLGLKADNHGFTVSHHVVETHGQCLHCQQKQGQK
ncbi:zinc uptake transcriptional repressor Zur [Parasalinivibrio latis]|uniref:zinc uptake transcriptional repressor Zur n=1 Tax=Parasalinivibrio latis TaxID=2952610 RepID=UPI0030DE6627